MARLTKNVLLDRICTSFGSAGWGVELLSEPGVHPMELRLRHGRDRFNMRVYIWNLTHGGRTRSESELRIQATGISSFERTTGAQTFILGWNQELEIFAGFDIDRHLGPLGSSPSLQISKSTLESARETGIAARTKSNNEIVVAVRPDLIGAYFENRARLHNIAEAQIAVDALREEFADEHIVRLSQLSSYIDLADDGAIPVLGTIEELTHRRAILQRLADLERELEEIRQQPGMIGHNRPPPDQALDEPSVVEVAGAVRALGQELERSDPRPVEVTRRAIAIEAAAAVWQVIRTEAAKGMAQVKDEFRKRTVQAATSAILGGAIYHKLIAPVIDSVLSWLRSIFP